MGLITVLTETNHQRWLCYVYLERYHTHEMKMSRGPKNSRQTRSPCSGRLLAVYTCFELDRTQDRRGGTQTPHIGIAISKIRNQLPRAVPRAL